MITKRVTSAEWDFNHHVCPRQLIYGEQSASLPSHPSSLSGLVSKVAVVAGMAVVHGLVDFHSLSPLGRGHCQVPDLPAQRPTQSPQCGTMTEDGQPATWQQVGHFRALSSQKGPCFVLTGVDTGYGFASLVHSTSA